jgi:hypothetical protein
MTYIDESLGSNESLYYRARFPGARYAGAWGLLVLMGVAAVLIVSSGYDRIGLILILVGLATFVGLMLPIWTTEIGVTTQRLIFKRGLFWRTTKELQLRAIEEINLDQGLIGRLLNYGRINLHGNGLDDISLAYRNGDTTCCSADSRHTSIISSHSIEPTTRQNQRHRDRSIRPVPTV